MVLVYQEDWLFEAKNLSYLKLGKLANIKILYLKVINF